MRPIWRAALCAPLILGPAMAAAQVAPQVGVETTSDERRRGLSWSEGRASVSADLSAEAVGLRASSRVALTRGSPRHGGADAVVDLTLSSRRSVGPIDIELRARGHLFAGARGRLDYGEIGGGASYSLGPLTIDAGVDFAPDQAAIGGSNLYLYAGATAGVPGTPLTMIATVGRTTGSSDDPARAARLRPAGSYRDWRIGIDHVRGRLTLGVDHIGTDVGRSLAISPFADARHAGDRLVARARLAF